MVSTRILAGLAALMIAGAAAPAAAGDEAEIESAAPLLWQPSMNVFRLFSVEPEQMFEFYGGVLGLEQLQTFNVGADGQVHRFRVGNSELKLRRDLNREYLPGGVDKATGLRLLTFFYPEREPVVERFRAHRLPEPDFTALPGTNWLSAIVNDPQGHAVEIVVAPNAPAELYDTIEVGLTVGDLERSRKFYREFVGLEELEPTDDPRFGTKKYSYKHGTTIVSLRHFGADLPGEIGVGGIQYVVTAVDPVDGLAKAHGVQIDRPLSPLQGYNLRTIWLSDPDGVTNYFAETAVSRQASRP